MRRLWVQLLAVFVKEIRQTVQDRRIVFLLTLAPMIQLTMFGYAIDLDVDHVPTVVVDLDHTPQSRSAISGMLADGTLVLADQLPSVPEAEEALEAGWAAVALVVPAGYASRLARRDPVQVQVLLDGTDPTRSSVAAGAASGYLASQLPQGRGPSVEVRPRLLYNPGLSSPVYMVPGITGMLLLIITTVITSMGLAREREVGTLEQVRVTPLPPAVLMVGKVAPFVVIGLVDVTAAIALGAWLFDVPVRGSMVLFYAITAAYLLNTIGIGLLVSTVSASQQQAFIGAFLFMLPALLLSGTMTPIHAMPDWLVPLTWVNPLRFYLEAVRGVLLKGATAADLWPQITILTTYGLLIITTAASRFQKRVA
jgi:ABC-2 type transport system permease protein